MKNSKFKLDQKDRSLSLFCEKLSTEDLIKLKGGEDPPKSIFPPPPPPPPPVRFP